MVNKLNKKQLSQKMWNMNYNFDAIDQAVWQLDIINSELKDGNDLESILDDLGIFHRCVCK